MKTAWGVLALAIMAWTLTAMGQERMASPIEEVKARYEARLLARPGVVSVGIGKDAAGRPAIIVGIKESKEALAPKVIPEDIEGYPVIVEVVGQVRAQ